MGADVCHTAGCCRRHRRALCAVNVTTAEPVRQLWRLQSPVRAQSRAAALATPRNCTVPSSVERLAPLRFDCPPTDDTRPRNASIPPVVHFVYALRRNAPFAWGQYVAVRSALAVHRPARQVTHGGPTLSTVARPRSLPRPDAPGVGLAQPPSPTGAHVARLGACTSPVGLTPSGQ